MLEALADGAGSNLIGQFGVGCMMCAVTAFLSLPLACGDDIPLGNPAVGVDVVIDGAGCAGMAAADHLRRAGVSFVVLEAQSRTERKDKDSPTVRAYRVLDLAEQEGPQNCLHPWRV